MMRGTFESKDPGDKVSLPFDFSDDLGTATIASVATTIALNAGDEGATPTTVSLYASETIVAGLVYVPAQGGVHFCDYIIGVAATLSDARVLTLAGLLPVRNA